MDGIAAIYVENLKNLSSRCIDVITRCCAAKFCGTYRAIYVKLYELTRQIPFWHVKTLSPTIGTFSCYHLAGHLLGYTTLLMNE